MQHGPTFQLMLLLGVHEFVSPGLFVVGPEHLRASVSHLTAFLLGALCHSGLSAPRDAAPFDAFAVFGDVVLNRPRTAAVSFQALGRYGVSCVSAHVLMYGDCACSCVGVPVIVPSTRNRAHGCTTNTAAVDVCC